MDAVHVPVQPGAVVWYPEWHPGAVGRADLADAGRRRLEVMEGSAAAPVEYGHYRSKREELNESRNK